MLLKIGSDNDDVKRLQRRLSLNDDGDFGPNTEKAVKAWQTANNLPASGIIDDAIWAILFRPVTFKLDALKGKIPDSVLSQIPKAAIDFNISNVLRLSHFLSQCGHESGSFKLVEENLNYSAERLKEKFGKYFPGDLQLSYAKIPVKIASRVYGSRMGNGDEASQEGYKFRGRGYIQLTGKDNYTSFARFIGEDTVANPDLVATKYPLASAAFFFNSKRLWTICDKGSTEAVIKELTLAVNAGLNGLPDRIKHFNEYYNLLK
jgi:putative chitinase